jgi:hypothetical protein
MVFLNTVTHLRAYLAAFPPPETDKGYPEARPEPNKSEKKVPLIIVYGLLELHRDTSEWSVQGLGSSIAVLVEAGWRAGQRIEVLEEKVGREEQHGESEQPQSVLEERLPMLNGNVRRAGLEGEDAVWSGRTVEVRRVLGRWFWFGKGYW